MTSKTGFVAGAPIVPVTSPLTERERAINDDFEWARHEPEVVARDAGMVVVVHQRRILSSGRNYGEALKATPFDLCRKS